MDALRFCMSSMVWATFEQWGPAVVCLTGMYQGFYLWTLLSNRIRTSGFCAILIELVKTGPQQRKNSEYQSGVRVSLS